MPAFNADEWNPIKGTYAFQVDEKHMVDIWVSCTKTVTVFGVSKKGRIVLKSGTEFRFRGQVKGFRKIEIVGTGQTLFGLKVRETAMQNGEDISDEKPLVLSLPEPSNLVLKMRRLAAEHHSRNRMPVLEPEDGPSFGRYEYEDEEEVLFEEEAFAKSQEEAKKRKEAKEAEEREKAKGRKEPVAGTSHEPPEPPQEAKPPEARVDPAPPAKAAE